MIIHIKQIEHERIQDAPFIGALICSIDCNINCIECFNQHLKQELTIEIESEKLIKIVKSNPFNKGIILSGLEWTLQPEEMKELIHRALRNNLEVILYTGLNEDIFKSKFQDIYNLSNIYIKFGDYDKKLKIANYSCCGVNLATSNQKIYKKGIDYET